MKQRIVQLGPPASGKGTQAEMIQARFQLPVTSPGTNVREERRRETSLGMEAKKATSQGQLVPDEVINVVVERCLAQDGRAIVFDGYPRSGGQASALDAMLARREITLDATLLLELDLPAVRDRFRRRMMCPGCGRIVSVGLHVADGAAPCSSCSGKLTKRLDDSPETLELRMNEYACKTEPLIPYYRERGLLHRVWAGDTPEGVFESAARILEGA